jgi:hypothetical protein
VLPSTWLLRRLRKAVKGDTDAAAELEASRVVLTAAWLADARLLRDTFKAVLEECGHEVSGAEDCFLDAWKLFASLLPSHPLYLQPLFQENSGVNILRKEARRIICIELLAFNRGPGVSATGHKVLGGAPGVGKTYILRGLALAISVMCETAEPITFDYEGAGVPTSRVKTLSMHNFAAMVPISVLLNAEDLYNSCASQAECNEKLLQLSGELPDELIPIHADAVQSGGIFKTGRLPVLLLDEIHLWYRRDSLQPRGCACVQQLKHFARNANVVAIVAGSSSCLRQQVYGLESWSKDYEILNGTQFRYCEISPLRDVTILDSYMKETRISLPIGLSLEQLLSLSGGVGRVIADVVGGERTPAGRINAAKLFCQDSYFAMLIAHMLADEANKRILAEAESTRCPRPIGMGLASVNSFMRDAQVPRKEAARLLEQWRGLGVLLCIGEEGPNPRIEILYPYQAIALQDMLDNPAITDLVHARMQLHGVHGSLGHCLQKLCRPQLSKLFTGCSQLGTTLSMKDNVAFVVSAGGEPVHFSPLHFHGQVIEWLNHVGLEDFALYPDVDDSSILHIDAWQCMSPYVGTIASIGETAVESIIESKTLSGVSDPIAYLHHAIDTARWGFCHLIGILGAAAKRCNTVATFLPRTLFVRSTAVHDNKAWKLSRKPVKMETALIVAYNTTAKAKAWGACPAIVAETSFFIHLADGLEWTDELLPADLIGCFSKSELKAREAAAREKAKAILTSKVSNNKRGAYSDSGSEDEDDSDENVEVGPSNSSQDASEQADKHVALPAIAGCCYTD